MLASEIPALADLHEGTTSSAAALAASDVGPAELTTRAAKGERAAEGALCLRLAPAVRAYARRRLRGWEAAIDFEQDVMLLLVQAVRNGAVEDGARIGGFVLGICKNVARDRAKQRERRQELWDLFGHALEKTSAPEHADEFVLRLEACLTQVSQRARDAIRLAYAEERSHAEIANHLGITEAAARVLRHRTLGALRECMSAAATEAT